MGYIVDFENNKIKRVEPSVSQKRIETNIKLRIKSNSYGKKSYTFRK